MVGAVLEATVEELARVGFGGLSTEAVATRAGVNKTTVYRRWPTRGELVRAALLEFQARVFEDADTGTLRGDLLELLRGVRVQLGTARGRGVTLALMADDPHVRQLARSTRRVAVESSLTVLDRAARRGELPDDVDRALLLDVLFGPLEQKMVIEGLTVDDAWLERLVDLVLRAVLQPAVTNPARAAPKRRARS